MLAGALSRPVPKRKLPPACLGLQPLPTSSVATALHSAGAAVCAPPVPTTTNAAATSSVACVPAVKVSPSWASDGKSLEEARRKANAGVIVGGVVQVAQEMQRAVMADNAATAVTAESPSLLSSSRSKGKRVYELVVHNYTDRHFKLTGPAQPLYRKVPLGRLLRLQAVLPPVDASTAARACSGTPPAFLASHIPPSLVIDPEAKPTAQAAFGDSADSANEDALEFTLSFMDASSEEGFTVRVHAHARSPLRSDAIASGQGLNISSTLESVPRVISQPPPGYAETALGVYRKPEMDETSRVGTISEGDEVLTGGQAREGRWIHISVPLEGWIQARTRDGRPLLEETLGQANIRQVVSIRPRSPVDMEATLALDTMLAKGGQNCTNWPSGSWIEKEPHSWSAEIAHFKKSAALFEAMRLDKEASSLEAKSLLGGRSRKALVGVLPGLEI